jgi:hypothetical protein
MEAQTDGEKVVLRGQGFTLIVMEGGLEDLPATVKR